MVTDKSWEVWGQRDPYFGVLTDPRFRGHSLTDEARLAFFRSGTDHVAQILKHCEETFGRCDDLDSILDFGCGVGRTLLAFAGKAASVVGVDVSQAMLDEAQRNCEEAGINNVRLLPSVDVTSVVGSMRFDLVHSFIVLQHIEANRALRVFQELLSLVADDGVVAIHVLFASASQAASSRPLVERLIPISWKRRLGKASSRSRLRLAASRRGWIDPGTEMNEIDLNRAFLLLRDSGFRNVRVEFTDHDSAIGALILGQRVQ